MALLHPDFHASPDATPLQPLLVAATANGEGDARMITKPRDYNLYCYGVFGGATVSLKWRIDDAATYVNFKDDAAADIAITQPSIQYVLLLSAGMEVVAEITGATGTTNINVYIG